MNGKNYGKILVDAVGQNTNLNIGTCMHACNGKDFHGNIYAFKWANSFKSADEIAANWLKSE